MPTLLPFDQNEWKWSVTQSDPSRFPPCLCPSPLWWAGALAHPRAALPSAPSFLAGLAALPPGWQQAFPTASRSWAAGAGCYCCLLIRGPRWETRRHTAMPSTLGAQQRTEHHHLLHRRVLWPECTLEGKKPVGAGIFCTPACCANPECKCCYRCCVCWCFLPRRSLQKHFIIMSMGHSPFHRYSRSSFFFSGINKQNYRPHLLHCTKDHQYPSSLTTVGW